MLSFTITQPSGKPLTDYRKCCEPHAGVDLIIVRSDDSHVQYDDSDIAADGKITQPVVFPAPGRYRIVVSAFLPIANPQTQNNFQLFTTVTARGHYKPQPIPPSTPPRPSTGTASRSKAPRTCTPSRPASSPSMSSTRKDIR